MNCLEFRRLTLIDPSNQRPALMDHLDQCAACTKFAEQMVRQDELIKEASVIDAPEGFAARILLNQSLQSQSRRPTRRYWLSLAASLLVAVVFLPALIGSGPYQAEDLIAHVEAHNVLNADHEIHTDEMQIRQVLANAGTAMSDEMNNVVYATTCVIDGEHVAHLLVKSGERKYVVFLIPQSILINRSFNSARWHGQLARLNDRSIAVMGRANDSNLSSATDAFIHQFSLPLSSGQTI